MSTSIENKKSKKENHVINPIVNNIYQNLIKEFLAKKGETIENLFRTKGKEDIKDRAPTVYKTLTEPWSRHHSNLIDNVMVVVEDDSQKLDCNDEKEEQFKTALQKVQTLSLEVMEIVWSQMEIEKGKVTKLKGNIIIQVRDKARNAVRVLNQESDTRVNGLYVNENALKVWTQAGTKEENKEALKMFRNAQSVVASMLDDLAGRCAESLLIKWTLELFQLMVTIEPQEDSETEEEEITNISDFMEKDWSESE
ncbi:unnamed protein product [Meganyctiphanes norvegica]|uniref:Uncharacterized protein n=1 Tax=Meganyctiphanes norvegica TaxID=48144 RepID=A0AAV2PXC2_MEGNR